MRESLQLGLLASHKKVDTDARIEVVAQTFPRLKERLAQEATSMSGGEQQMPAIARAMMAEPSEGIMPVLVDEMFKLFARLKASGVTLLLVEQNVARAGGVRPRRHPRPGPGRA